MSQLDDPRIPLEKILTPRNILSRIEKLEDTEILPTQPAGDVTEIFTTIENTEIIEVVDGNGNVISDSQPAEIGHIAVYSNVDGFHIEDSGYIVNDVLFTSPSLFYFSNTASDIAGYKTLVQSWADVSSGTSSKACTAASDYEIVEEFSTTVIDSPLVLRGIFKFGFYVSTNVDGNVGIEYKIYIRTSGGAETEIFDGNGIFALTGTPSLVSFVGVGLEDDLIINSTDRLIVKIGADVSADSTITIQNGSSTYPAHLVTPLYKFPGDMLKSIYDPTNIEADAFDSANFTGTNWTDLTDSGETTLHTHPGGGGGLTHPQVMARISVGF